jgi:hypothetical protein
MYYDIGAPEDLLDPVRLDRSMANLAPKGTI